MSLSYQALESQLRDAHPAILIGMHRSGTSLTTRLLVDVGVHMGRRLSTNAESIYFQRLNRRILADVGARWDQIEPIVEAMRSDGFCGAEEAKLRRALFRGRGMTSFFGRDLWASTRRGESVAWGWKDPRTTLTFPIWQRLFPGARFVHVIRNGIDVAISIHRRALAASRHWKKRFLGDLSPATARFEDCFHLWEQYVAFALEEKHLIDPERYLEVRYEDLLRAPHEHLEQIVNFLGHPINPELIQATSKRVDQSHLDNSRNAEPYQDVIPTLASSPLMQHLGYGQG
jgi:hypothetical protein